MASLPTTNLELCQDLVKETPIAGPIDSVIGVAGELERVVNWVAVACLEIESMYMNWDFLSLPEYTFNTIVGVRDYPAPADWNWWDDKGFMIPADEMNMQFLDWHNKKRDPSLPVSGTPFQFSVLPNGTIRLYDTPDAIITIRAPYWVQPSSLINNADTPFVPVRYRKIITYRAMKLYAQYESNDEIDAKASDGLNLWLPKLQALSLPGNQGMQGLNTNMDIQITSPQQTDQQLLDVFFN